MEHFPASHAVLQRGAKPAENRKKTGSFSIFTSFMESTGVTVKGPFIPSCNGDLFTPVNPTNPRIQRWTENGYTHDPQALIASRMKGQG